jgi:hypothetical protein
MAVIKRDPLFVTPSQWFQKFLPVISVLAEQGLDSTILSLSSSHTVEQCFSNLVLGRGVRGSEIRKCVMAEEYYWRPNICMYECK